MFIIVCGWIFCAVVLIGLIILAIEAFLNSRNISYDISCDSKKNNGICARRACGTWYGYYLKTTTGQRRIIWKKLFINCAFFMLPLVWACIVLIFAI